MKAPLRLLLAALCLLVCTLTAAASEPEVDSYDITCQIDQKGRQTWTLDLTMVLPEDCTRLEIPLPGTARQVKVSGVRHSVETGEGGKTTLVLTDSEGFASTQSFRITWRSSLDLTREEATTLTLPLLSSYFPWQVSSLSYSVTLPAAPMTEDIRCQSGYYGDLDTEVCSLVLSGSQVSGSVPEGFLAYDSFTLQLTLPEGTFTVPNAFVRYLSTPAGLLELLALAALLAALGFWFFRCRSGAVRVRTRPLPPDGVTAGDLPYVLQGKGYDLTALILEWAAAGYVSVYVRQGQVVLRQRMTMGSERSSLEQQLSRVLFSQGRLCALPDSGLDRPMAQFRSRAQKALYRQLFVPGKPALRRLKLLSALSMALSTGALVRGLLPQGWGWTVLSLLALVPGLVWGLYLQYGAEQLPLALDRKKSLQVLVLAGLIGILGLLRGAWMLLPASALGCFVGLQTAFGGRRTRAGQDALQQALGFRQYLLQVPQEQLQDALQRDPMYFYRLLPWAQSLGLGGTFARRFGDLPLEAADWLQTPERTLTAARFYELLTPVLKLLRH